MTTGSIIHRGPQLLPSEIHQGIGTKAMLSMSCFQSMAECAEDTKTHSWNTGLLSQLILAQGLPIIFVGTFLELHHKLIYFLL